MQHNLREFLRHGGSGQYVFARQKGVVYGYRAGISIKSLFPGYAELRADFTVDALAALDAGRLVIDEGSLSQGWVEVFPGLTEDERRLGQLPGFTPERIE